ncbi:MAG: hypothetical protein IJD91_07425 [Clostridia bacterium]|nr:hypothetical protein [Clostridia bacterium]
MKVTLRQIVLAIPALAKLTACNLNLRSAYKLKKSVEELQKEADFFSEERRKVIQKYSHTDKEGAVVLDTAKEEKAVAAMEELLDMEVTPNAAVVEIPITEDITLSVNDIELLAPFVKFTDTEETS